MRIAPVVVAVSCLVPTIAHAVDPLPEGDHGIAAGYPGDEGIAGDPAVFLFEDFEGYTEVGQLWDRWDSVYQESQLSFTTEAANVWAGAQAIEMTVPQQDAELSNSLDKAVTPERDVFFLRYYSKFSTPFDVVGSSHNGSSISAHYFIDGQATPGIPADGMNKFLVAYENWRGEAATVSPGDLNVYVYHPEQRDDYGDHFFPTGLVMPNTSLPFDFGPEFVPREDVIQELDRWYCYELMVQANTPGQRDGRIAFWLDGVLAADFHNLRLRDIETLTIDRFGIGLHIGSNPNGVQTKWYDNVVAADAYIGPMFVEDGGGSGSEGSASAGSEGTASDASESESASDGSDASASADDGSDASAGDTGGSSSVGQRDDADRGCGCRLEDRGGLGLAILGGLALLRRRRSAASVSDRPSDRSPSRLAPG